MKHSYFTSVQFVFDVVIGIGFVIIMAVLIALIWDHATNTEAHK